jgi:hypothetical protein
VVYKHNNIHVLLKDLLYLFIVSILIGRQRWAGFIEVSKVQQLYTYMCQ